MWIFLSDTFLSIVEYRDNPELMLVRARVAGDIEQVFPGTDVSDCPTCDYRFRALVPRETVADAVRESVMRIDYDNFKNSVTDPDRHNSYFRVWSTMYELQDRLL